MVEQRDGLRRNLSSQELACLRHLMSGKTDNDIAEALQLRPTTVASYLTSVYRKLGTRNRTHAVAVAIREGIVRFDRDED